MLEGTAIAGLRPELVAAELGIESLLDDPSRRIDDPTYSQFWLLTREMRPDPLWPATLGKLLPFGVLGCLDYLVANSATVGASLSMLAERAHLLIDDACFSVSPPERGQVRLAVVHDFDFEARDMSDEFTLALLATRLRRCLPGSELIAEVQLTGRTPTNISEWTRWFGASVSFGHHQAGLVFARGIEAAAMPSADPHLLALLLRTLEAGPSATVRDPSRPTAAFCMRYIQSRVVHGAAPVLREAAARRGVSARTLQRSLRREHTEFGALVDTCRERLAKAALLRGQSVLAVALQVGFGEERAFARAFRRWTGLTPSDYREQQVLLRRIHV